MRIGIDISFVTNSKAGIEQYLYNLLNCLAKSDSQDSYFLYSNKDVPEEFSGLGDNFSVRVRRNRFLPRVLWVQFVLPGLLKQDGIDLLQAPCYVAPYFLSCSLVITFHDMASWLFPKMFRLKHRIVHGLLVPLFARKADRIIAVSEATKRDMVKLFKLPEDRITVIYEGANERFSPVNNTELLDKTRVKYNLPLKYILYVGTLEPRKNIPVLLKAFKRLKASGGIDHKLVMVGKKGWLYGEIFETVRSLKLDNDVIFTGYIGDKELPLVYSGAELFVYPSSYEGFGLPPLEAMSCGVPVITSNVSSLPEVVGDAALLIDPEDINELSGAMDKAINDTALREQMIKKGLERSGMFSWEKAAQETLGLWNRVYGAFKGKE